MAHQEVALWVAYRHGRPVGRIGACVDSFFNEYQKVRWGWVGFFDMLRRPRRWPAPCSTRPAPGRPSGAPRRASGRPYFTTNDELGLLVDGFDIPPTLLTLQNPRYYEALWVDHGWEPAMDLWAWHFDKATTALSERQRRTLDRIQQRAKVRGPRHPTWTTSTPRSAASSRCTTRPGARTGGSRPMPEAEVRHLAKQLKQIINPNWAFGLETADGQAVAVCLALPDVNQLMRRVRSGRLLPFGWYPLLTGRQEAEPRPGVGPRRPARLPAPGARSAAVPGDRRPAGRRPLHPHGGGVVDAGDQPPDQRPAGGHGRPPLEGVAAVPAAGVGWALRPAPQPVETGPASKPARARSMSASVWVAMTEVRSTARGTAGGMAQLV